DEGPGDTGACRCGGPRPARPAPRGGGPPAGPRDPRPHRGRGDRGRRAGGRPAPAPALAARGAGGPPAPPPAPLPPRAGRPRSGAQRTVTRVVLGLIAFALLMGALVFLHIAAWYWLRQSFDRPPAALIIAGAELLVAAILGLIAARSSPGRIEAEALAVRKRA